ncbi:carbohydrate kinase [Dokdonella soli]|uniref:Carbohydrate kinase n=1 Tax=Dokdonella soli TaxID=529810 RepID=A0ABN1IVD0_9GAMM
MQRIVCFGEALIDFLAQPAQAPGEPRAFLQYAGGAPANVAVAVARLGGRADFVGMLGADMFGDFLLESLRAAGVGTGCSARTVAAKTALAFVALDPEGERSFSFYRPPAADLLFRAEHFQPECFADTGAFHVCSNSLTEDAIAATTLQGIARARDAGALVSFDMNLRPALWPQGIDPHPRLWDVLMVADLIKLARAELDYVAGPLGDERTVMTRLWEGRAKAVIITDGAAPIRWFTRDAAGQVPSFRVRALDTTAAGDAFVGGLLYRLAEHGVDGEGLPVFVRDAGAFEGALRFAAAVGGLTVTRHGAFAAMPALAEVEQLLREQYEHAA